MDIVATQAKNSKKTGRWHRRVLRLLIAEMQRPIAPAALIILLLLTGSRAFASLPDPLRINSGPIRGVAGATPDIRVFKGIPYAAAPVGALRWRAPQPVQAWETVRPADRFGPVCPQPAPNDFYRREYFTGPQPQFSEDCLYLNVWTDASSSEQRRPVMLWIHGGGNVQGYGSEPAFDGEAFARHGVVLVTFNYRLNIFGLFAHPELRAESEHHVSGNYQELDQIAALQWVHRNIAAFGGDPNNVTIFGQSSGAASVNRLLCCPLAKGLFHKVICESAAILNSRDSRQKLAEMEKRGVACAEALGAHSLADLRAKSADELLAATNKFRFDPTIDGYVLPELAVDVFARGGQDAVPMMIGSTADEGPYAPMTAAAFRDAARKRFGDGADRFLSLYPADTDEQAAQSKHDARRDESFTGERAEARAQAKLGVPVYLYYFSRKPPGHDRDKYGAFHSADVEYVFNTLGATDRPWEQTDRDLATAMIQYWTNFAATGNPNAKDLPDWPAYDSEKDSCMEFGDSIAAHPVTRTEKLEFLEPHLDKDAH